jgi:hypothetical protein
VDYWSGKGGSMKERYNTFRFFLACAIIFGSGLFCGKASQRCRQTVCCISVLTCCVSIVAWACSYQPIAPNLTRFPIEVRPLKSCVFDQCQRSEISGAWTGNAPNNAMVLLCQFAWLRGLCDLSRFVPAVSLRLSRRQAEGTLGITYLISQLRPSRADRHDKNTPKE